MRGTNTHKKGGGVKMSKSRLIKSIKKRPKTYALGAGAVGVFALGSVMGFTTHSRIANYDPQTAKLLRKMKAQEKRDKKRMALAIPPSGKKRRRK